MYSALDKCVLFVSFFLKMSNLGDLYRNFNFNKESFVMFLKQQGLKIIIKIKRMH